MTGLEFRSRLARTAIAPLTDEFRKLLGELTGKEPRQASSEVTSLVREIGTISSAFGVSREDLYDLIANQLTPPVVPSVSSLEITL